MDVRERLAGFGPSVDDAIGQVTPPMPGELWDRGQVWSNRRRRGSLVIGGVAAALVLAIISLGWVRATPVLPAVSPDAQVTLPDRVFKVPRWLPDGLAGEPVMGVTEATSSGWFGASTRLAALTGSGRYLFLDLPDYAGEGYALAPDGRHIGYWTVGVPSSDDITSGRGERPLTGVAVYDLVEGTTVRHELAPQHGLSPTGLLWADPGRLLGSYVRVTGVDKGENGMGWSGKAESWSWGLGDEAVSPLDLPGDTLIDPWAEAQDGVLLLNAGSHSWRAEVNSGRTTRLAVRSPDGLNGPASSISDLASDGTLSMVGDMDLKSNMVPNHVSVTSINRTGLTSRPRVVPGSGGTYQVLGWRTPSTLLLVRTHGDPSGHHSIDAVDVETGESDELVAFDPEGDLGWSWAEGLLTSKVAPGVAPPSPMDPRVLLGGLVIIALAAGRSLAWWRRRGQP